MIKSLKNIISPNRKAINEIECNVEFIPQNTFNLLYDKNTVGSLTYDNGTWFFNYSQWFKNQHTIKPLFEFPDINKSYSSKNLWPFFKSRIPSVKQQKVKEFVNSNPKDANNLVALLKKFGYKSVNNPYYLVTS